MKNELIIRKATDDLSDATLLLSNDNNSVYTILLTLEKEGSILLNQTKVDIPAFHIVFISPGSVISFPKDSRDMELLQFTSLFYSRSERDSAFLQSHAVFPLAGYVSYPLREEIRPYILYILNALYNASANMSDQMHFYLVHNMVEHVMIQYAIQNQSDTKNAFIEDADHIIATKFKQIIPNYIRKNRTVSFYADELNITTRRLSKATQNVLGKSPKDILTDFVVNEFKWKLIYTDLTIKEIGREYGFLDENNFSSFFQKEVGIRPSSFRKNKKNQ